MAIKIITPEERMRDRSIKGVIFGPHGIGKTSLLYTLPVEETLFLNLEAGDLAVQDWPGASIDIETWQEALDIACLAGGPNVALAPDKPFSQAHYDYVCQQYPEVAELVGRLTIHFWDSISVAARLCWLWAEQQPDSFNKQGNPDTRGTYGLLGRSVVQWLTHIQHTKGKTVWVLGGLDEIKDDFGKITYEPQIEGSKAGRELPGLFDQVISMVDVPNEEGVPARTFVCTKLNQWNYPAKDRSGKLQELEQPHLGNLMGKIKTTSQRQELTYTNPNQQEAQ